MSQIDIIARLAITHAITESFYDSVDDTILKQRVKAVTDLAETALVNFPTCNSFEIKRIHRKIDYIENNTSLGKPRSILTFIEMCVALLDEPARKCRNGRKHAIMALVQSLLVLRQEISGEREFILSQIAAAKIADVWDSIEI